MYLLRNILPYALFCTVGFWAFGQNSTSFPKLISGTLILDSIWEHVVYLSHIPTLNDLYTMSPKMIIAESKIDKNGHFEFASNFLDEKEQIFRIHISKKGAPKASLIIGGQDENYLFCIAGKKSKVHIANTPGQKILNPVVFKGNTHNKSLQKIDTIANYIDSTYVDASILKKEFVTKGIYEQLRYTADTATNSLVSLYAIYKSNYEQDISVNKNFYEAYLKKWKKEDSSYFNTFRKEIPKSPTNWGLWHYLLIGSALFASGYFLRKLTITKDPTDDVSTLTVQERKIFRLLKQGKSNKEISSEFNIGISTVKSHVSNIFSKLSINSRKDAMDL